MYILISVTRDELNIITSFHETEKEAYDAMVWDIIQSTPYNTEEEILKDSKDGVCSLEKMSAWAETSHSGTAQWNIVKIPSNTPE